MEQEVGCSVVERIGAANLVKSRQGHCGIGQTKQIRVPFSNLAVKVPFTMSPHGVRWVTQLSPSESFRVLQE